MIPADLAVELVDSIFSTESGFATTHTVNGVAGIVCVVGEKTTGHSNLDGAWVTMFEVMFKTADIATIPEKRKKMLFDGATYTVENVKDYGEVLTITLSLAREGAVLNEL